MNFNGHFSKGRRSRSFMTLCLACFFFWPAQSLAVGGSGSAGRGFKAEVSLAMAVTAATAEARMAAMESAVRDLSAQERVRLFLSGEVMRDAPRPDPLALAWALLSAEEAESSVSGVPPDMLVHVSLCLRFDLGEGGMRLVRLLARPELLDLYARALRLQGEALKGYDAATLFFLRPGTAALADKKAAAKAAYVLDAAFGELEASVGYLALLPALHPLDDGMPDEGGRDLLPLLERLAALAPDHYLLSAELARLHLLNGGALKARDMLDRVISFHPDFAQAYDWRGLSLLWLELPSLALADFNRAIRLEPYHPGFFENRALTQRILENVPAMCADLAESCRLGECAGLEWSAVNGLCAR